MTFLRIDDVTRVTGLPRSTVYYLIARGEFPRAVKLSPGRRGWLESEVTEWQRARLAERDGATAPEAA